MSAITGIFFRKGKSVDPQLMKKMNDKLSHRGVDGSHIWVEGSVGLGHQMLHTTPESLHEKLPFKERDLVITADARIDNREELAKKLGIDDVETVSDSYFILKAYEMWGEDCPDKLLGDFAFAIWDKEKEMLFCARDHMGVKPFYYYVDEEMFVFGSEIKALFEISNLKKEINENYIAKHLALILREKKMTAYLNILRLPAANYLKLNFNQCFIKEYWDLNLNHEIHLESDEEYEKEFLEIFTKSVESRLRSAFPIGSMLSGGIDSSSVTCISKKILANQNKTLKTYSAVFDSVPESNERYFIEKILETGEFEPYFLNGDEISPLGEIDQLFYYSDQQLIFPNSFMIWNILREANNSGTRILLDGLEGDIVVSHGTGYLKELFIQQKLNKFLLETKSLSKRKEINQIMIILGVLKDITFENPLFSWIYNYQIYHHKTKIINKKFANNINLKKLISNLVKKDIKIKSAKERHYDSINSGLIQYEMEVVDWMSSPFCIEQRHPFYDKRLVEFCLAIPTEQKFSYGWDRSIMRRAITCLPKEIKWRKNKGNLGHNHNLSMIKYEKNLLDYIILENPEIIKKYIDIKKLQKSYFDFISGFNKDVIHIWQAVILFLWIKRKE